jgi:hypothetical protein
MIRRRKEDRRKKDAINGSGEKRLRGSSGKDKEALTSISNR